MDHFSVILAGRGDMQSFSENYIHETVAMKHARDRAEEIGTTNTQPIVGAFLRYLTHLVGATSVVEVGTGSGVSGLWLFQGMSPTGVLTSIDSEVENSRIAKSAFDEADISSTRYRLISGNSNEIIAKLADSLYDVFILRPSEDLIDCIEHAHRALRPGGILLIDGALSGGKVPDPSQRDRLTISLRDSLKILKEAESNWLPLLLPVADGLFLATKLK